VTQAAISGVQIPCDLRESITHTIETGTRTLQEGGLEFWNWSLPMGAVGPGTMQVHRLRRPVAGDPLDPPPLPRLSQCRLP
jgi:hypothetical protein